MRPKKRTEIGKGEKIKVDLQDLILGLSFIEVNIEFELFLFFLFGWRRKERKGKRDIVAVLGVYFLLLAIGRILLIIYDFHLAYSHLYLIGIAFSLLGMILFIFIAEYIVPFNTHYIFTLLGIGTLISIFFVNIETAKLIMYIMLPIIFIMGFGFLGFLIHRTSGTVRHQFVIILVGQFVYGVGQGFNTDFVQNLFFDAYPLFDIRFVGLSCIVVGLIFIALAFWRLPSFTEIEWHSKMVSLYVITTEHGLCCLHYPFRAQTGSMAPQLISGGVSGILSLVKEMTSSKMHLKVLDHEDVKILFEYGLYTTTVLLAEADLQIYHDKLKTFVEEFESKFKQYLIKWTGSMIEFGPAAEIVVRIFEQKKEIDKSSENKSECSVVS
ncbi:MAG TPA: hypothetical protein VMV49_15680 [Candidatus Deferrimicrobium sp.]|nr:hypothetical protein [Candidatus Deferrimicrobium sp.]